MLGELEELDEGADDGELDELEWPPEGDVDEGEVGDELELLELLLARGGVAEFVVLEELLDDALFPAFALLILPLELDCGLVDIEPGGEVVDDVLGELGDVGDVGDVVDG